MHIAQMVFDFSPCVYIYLMLEYNQDIVIYLTRTYGVGSIINIKTIEKWPSDPLHSMHDTASLQVHNTKFTPTMKHDSMTAWQHSVVYELVKETMVRYNDLYLSEIAEVGLISLTETYKVFPNNYCRERHIVIAVISLYEISL